MRGSGGSWGLGRRSGSLGGDNSGLGGRSSGLGSGSWFRDITRASDQGRNLGTRHLVVGGTPAVDLRIRRLNGRNASPIKRTYTLAGNARVGVLVGSREGHELASFGDTILVAADLDLGAGRIELGLGCQV